MEGLEDRLQAHSTYFSSMVELIPANYYVVREQEGADEEDTQRTGRKRGNRFWHNVKGSKEPVQKSKKKKTDSDSSRKNMDKEGREEIGVEGEGGDTHRDKRQKEFSVEHVRSATLSELHGRLQRRLEELRGRRKCDEDGGSKHAAQRTEERKKRKNILQREKEAKQKRVAMMTGRGGGEGVQPPPTASAQLSFSRFEFNTDNKPDRTRKNYHALVKRAEANQRKLEEMKITDEEKGEKLQEKQKWMKAVEMARGTKLKDDPKLLKKTMKRLDKRKKLSQKNWEERLLREEERKESKQQKRRQNIKERTKLIQAKKARKRAKKKGKL